MSLTVLNAKAVESIHRAVAKGKAAPSLDGIDQVTLAGLLEYGCLRREYGDVFPAVPGSVRRTEMGEAIERIASPLGVRVAGPAPPEVRSIAAGSIEFIAIPPSEVIADDRRWDLFLARFENSAADAGFGQTAATQLMSALHEMAENAVLHSLSPIQPVAGYQAVSGTALFTIADVGIGVRRSLATNPRYAQLGDDTDAVMLAMRTGVTSRSEGGGFGFDSVFKALTEMWGTIRLRSGNGCVSLDGTGLDADQCVKSRPLAIPGFQVSICCRLPGCEIDSPF